MSRALLETPLPVADGWAAREIDLLVRLDPDLAALVAAVRAAPRESLELLLLRLALHVQIVQDAALHDGDPVAPLLGLLAAGAPLVDLIPDATPR